MTMVTWASEYSQFACRAAKYPLSLSGLGASEVVSVHVSAIARPQRQVVKTANGRSTKVIEQCRVDNLLDRNSSDVVSGEK